MPSVVNILCTGDLSTIQSCIIKHGPVFSIKYVRAKVLIMCVPHNLHYYICYKK